MAITKYVRPGEETAFDLDEVETYLRRQIKAQGGDPDAPLNFASGHEVVDGTPQAFVSVELPEGIDLAADIAAFKPKQTPERKARALLAARAREMKAKNAAQRRAATITEEDFLALLVVLHAEGSP